MVSDHPACPSEKGDIIMTENAKAFFAEVSKNEELRTRLGRIDRSDMKTAIPFRAFPLLCGWCRAARYK